MTYTIVLDNNEYGWKNIIFPSFNEAIRIERHEDMIRAIETFMSNLLNKFDHLPDGAFSKPVHENQDRIRVTVTRRDNNEFQYYFFK